jgi:hypothetical protein
MAEHPFQGWLEKTANYSSVLACGVYVGPQSMAVKSFSESFPEAQIKEFLQRLAEIALALRVYQIGGSRMRWAFEHGQFHAAKRQDGIFAVLAVTPEPEAAGVIDELFADFIAMVAAPEKTTTRLSESTEPSPPAG